MSKPNYETQIAFISVIVYPSGDPPWPPRPPNIGMPIFIFIIAVIVVNERRNRKLRENTDVVSESDLAPATDGQPENVETRDL